jgi:hypothetical protein
MIRERKGALMHPRNILAAGAAVLVIGIAGCGGSSSSGGGESSTPVDPNAAEVSPPGDIPDNQAFVAYAPPGGGYSVKVPEGWGRTAQGRAVTFTDKLNAIRVEAVPANAAPTPSTAKSTELPKLARTVEGFQRPSVTTVTRKGGRAVRITYLADTKPDPVTGKTGKDAVERYLFFHNGRDLVLTLSGPKGADNVDPWMIVTNSVQWSQ